jgi:HAD superfamily hydrolase (TIGR01490 family)
MKIALFDVCHTLVKVTTINDFIEYFFSLKPRNWLIKKIFYFFLKIFRKLRLLNSTNYKKYLVKLFKGYKEEEILKIAKDYNYFHLQKNIKEEVFKKLIELKQSGYNIFLISGGLDIYLKEFANFLGVNLICTVLEKNEKNIFTGNILGLDCVGKNKVLKLKEALPYFEKIDWENSVAFGDSLSDIYFLSLVKNVTVVDPDHKLEKIARKKGWEIIKTKK